MYPESWQRYDSGYLFHIDPLLCRNEKKAV